MALEKYIEKLANLAYEFGEERGFETAEALDNLPVGWAKLDLKDAMRDFSENYFGGAKLPWQLKESLKEGMITQSIAQFRNQGYRVTRHKQKR
ncbi:MAG: hypothetical protein KGH71_01225 [Candidatus Micrarchaeota archaeon]|nr:hypothetical protein [Candidatus Micrarchaeota archaeon]